MKGDNAPPGDGWKAEPKPWDAEACCPACQGVCEVPANIELGEN